MPYTPFYGDIYGATSTEGACAFSDIYTDAYCPGATTAVLTPVATGLQILARNPDLSIAGEIEYTTAELVLRYDAVGSWTLECGFDGDLDTPCGVLLTPGAGIVAVINGHIVMSGPVTKPARRRDGDSNTLSIGGVDDLVLVADRAAHQDPTIADTPAGDNTYTLAEYVQTGPVETVIKQFVDSNLGPHSIAARRVAALTIEPDKGRGATITGSGRQQNLLELIATLAKDAGGIGFQLVQSGRGVLRFGMYEPADKTASVVFSIGLANMQGYEYSSERPIANHVYAGGTGEGADRIFRIGEDATSVAAWGRIESFIDESSSETTAKLDQALAGELASAASRFYVTANAVNTGTHLWAPLTEDPKIETYDLGDQVSVVVDGQQITEVIRELHIGDSAQTGLTVSPVIGSADQSGRPEQLFFERIIAKVRSLSNQVRDLQRR